MRRARSLLPRPGLLVLLGLLLSTVLPGAWAASGGNGKVVMQIAVVRHGIRAPTDPPQALAVYSTDPWPAWPVTPGELTGQGSRLMHSVGTWYRADLSRAGLHLDNCAALRAGFKMITDTTQRNLDSAASMLDGLAPDCGLHYHALPVGHKDPLFRGVSETRHVTVKVTTLSPPTQAALRTLQETLLGCSGPGCLAQARAKGKTVLVGASPEKALHLAGTLSENLMLEYAQGMPLDKVGWGRLGADGIAWIITLHNASFDLRKGPQGPASARDGNMLAHITATLERVAGKSSDLASLVPTGGKALVLVGHDTDLATQAGLLGVDWHQVAQPDDYPPGGMLIYQLLDADGHYFVRVRVALPTLTGLRAANVVMPGGLHQATVPLPGCGGGEVCPLARFEALVDRAVPDSVVIPHSGNEPLVH